MAWATLADLEDDLNRDFSAINDLIDDTMITSHLTKSQGLITGYLGFTPTDINTFLWAVHLDLSEELFFKTLASMGINLYEYKDQPFDKTVWNILDKYLERNVKDTCDSIRLSTETSQFRLNNYAGYGRGY